MGTVVLYDEYIETLGTLPKFQGQGYGRQIIQSCLSRIQSRGFQKSTLAVLGHN
jgi:ribosomal protein S18 acetylase RimI-like enzyme